MMKFDPDRYHRRSIRLPGYDYAQVGAYFVTIVAQGRECMFGEVISGEMKLNDAGCMVKQWWLDLSRRFPTVETDEYIVMPNHLHGILVITVGADRCVGPEKKGAHIGAPLPTTMQWFKTMTTNEYIRGVKSRGWPPFVGKLWQRNYYEHIIRDERSLHEVRQYIENNPFRWAEDKENPVNAPKT
jgi:putative transposase